MLATCLTNFDSTVKIAQKLELSLKQRKTIENKLDINVNAVMNNSKFQNNEMETKLELLLEKLDNNIKYVKNKLRNDDINKEMMI